ncbi:arsenate reductase (azurin) large subunit [Meiothermus hypogaeus]|uniref:Arsenite oxidase large subunit n=2 Tax=Meiothermus hypogaeus TaxID=884155 RepID=A0A511R4W0_9DEIN|nr:arsenate reductase (azurin) large subunit [Meiothermus hypogaeus]RIH75168.1 Arsenite oxidase subunit AioA [Meiothermus hypogaeus]GEM84605.1 arsenite oxidase large subunit [Meiothermus hypogaeus NBRC 106114]GIW37411.1 MAG: arsenite oxidase large subunit [Meiothermus sp.]
MSNIGRRDALPIPPTNAEVKNTVCQYCTVGCGYKVYTWPVGSQGGLAANQNAFGVDLRNPQNPLGGLVYTETMHSIVTRKDGRQYHVVIVPANDSPINFKRDHSSRGATNAVATWSDARATKERLKYPLLRMGDQFQVITWDEALAILAGVAKGIRDKDGNDDNIVVKAFDHGGSGAGFENNWGVGSLFFKGFSVKHIGIHNRPAYNSEVWGSRERGVHELNYDAIDARLADTIVLWGANPYETASVFYTEHMQPNIQGATLEEKQRNLSRGEPVEAGYMIVVDPRRTSSLTIAENIAKDRTLHLRPNLGTDYILANAIARVMWERKYYDQRFLETRTDMAKFEEYKEKSLKVGTPYAQFMAEVERITGVRRADIEKAADWIAKPKAGGFARRTLTIYEKGIIWNMKNYDQVAAIVQMAVLGNNVGRAGTGCGRLGGHQEGYVRPPSPTPGSIYNGGPPVNVDKYLTDGKGKLYWVIGTNPYLSTPNNQLFRKRIRERTKALSDFLGQSGEPGTTQEWVAKILEGLDATNGLFMVVQDLYLIHTAQDAHLVLPASAWGEANQTSINCNSRLLRLYEKFMDPPGQAKQDWEICKLMGLKMAELYRAEGKEEEAKRFEFGKNWRTDEDVFLDGGNSYPNNAIPASEEATLPAECYKGVTYAFLRQVGQQGIRTPVRVENGKPVGTLRRYSVKFGTKDGKFSWYGTDDWEGYPEEVAKYLEGEKAQKYPFWMTTGRAQAIWQTMYNDRFLPEKMNTLPMPYIEIHPQDAQRLGLRGGDLAQVWNEEGNGTFLVYVTDSVRPGMIFALQYHHLGTSNSMTPGYTDPKTTIPWYKGTRVAIRKVRGALPDLQNSTSFLQQNKFD